MTGFFERLGVTHPIVQAPMAGGPTTPELVAAVSGAGALGSLGAAYLSGAAIREAVRAIRRMTERPFAVSLFVPEPDAPDMSRVAAAQALLAPYREELGLGPAAPPASLAPSFDEQLEATLEARPAVLSFTMGALDADHVKALKDRGTLVVGTATTVNEACILEATGVDAIVAQGSEAGGHRGTFAAPWPDALVGLVALVPQMVDAVGVPVIAAGGIMDGRGVAAALALGAEGAQLGTAFLACPEAAVDDVYRRALEDSTDESTTVTRAFSGRPARGLRNRFIDELDVHDAEIPPFPLQNALTRELRAAAKQKGRADLVSHWAGQASAMIRPMPAADLVATLARELADARARLAR